MSDKLLEELLNEKKGNAIDYNTLLSKPELIKKINPKDKQNARTINVFIPVRNRETYLVPCINYFKSAIKRAKIKVVIYVVEQDAQPKCQQICKNLGVNYIFLPNSLLYEEFNKSLLFNIGFKLARKANWNLFHDVDILVPKSFFVVVEKAIFDKNIKLSWVQPYSGRQVVMLDDNITQTIMGNSDKIYDLEQMTNYMVSVPGAPGGSILVSYNDFIKVGGYDPELFYSYSPEDSFFWTKLECLYRQLGTITECHQGSATYVGGIMVYHLNHPVNYYVNKKHDSMLKLLQNYWSLSGDQREQFRQLAERSFI